MGTFAQRSKKRSRNRHSRARSASNGIKRPQRATSLDVFEDDARFRRGQPACFVADNREFAERPKLQEFRAVGFVQQIDDALPEWDVELVEADQNLLTERRQRMKWRVSEGVVEGFMP
jgi:hypothetical protein